MEITKPEFEILLHTLGLTDMYQKESYRNFFESSAGHHDQEKIDVLVSCGFMKHVGRPSYYHRDAMLYVVTEKGKIYAESHRKKPTRGQRRYHNYLCVSDCYSELTFKKFLTHPEFAEYR